MSGPHDLFVRRTFGHPEHAAAELRAVLPPELVSQVDWDTLHREPGSVIDPELRETESDLLFSARLRGGGSLLCYVLIEHQSSVDRWMALRMLRYVVRQLERWRHEHPEHEVLPLILPLVLYHGPEGAWSAPRRVEELFEVPGEEQQPERWRALLPRFEYQVDDLTAERAEVLLMRPGPPLVRLAWRVLRYGRTEALAEQLPGWESLFAQVQAAPNGFEALGTVVHYLLWVGDEAAQAATVEVLHSVVGAQRAEELMPTVGEKIFEQGRQQGRQEGQQEGWSKGRAEARAESVLQVLGARGVHVDAQTRQRILSCMDMATLDQWFARALSATRLLDVLGDTTA
ncbi:Rpn family recombination-promoting nuclease/putative transposase [Hyalangium rubrum]|uniref:Rpn family recombination-promoting nuclease/putative transposase n=1 Tax=Hyalangium rubrum TaxID=3103134 RepID=A0ABU5HGS3_9BACT|nr:Rpn family recombination-promoting nuclease/putative transposase [Hyalangium sp. s54d21]MDY7232655.1 Rpn family recombination-promoting nuclease/putative transposase [Hyalangium sp. s54d21]